MARLSYYRHPVYTIRRSIATGQCVVGTLIVSLRMNFLKFLQQLTLIYLYNHEVCDFRIIWINDRKKSLVTQTIQQRATQDQQRRKKIQFPDTRVRFPSLPAISGLRSDDRQAPFKACYTRVRVARAKRNGEERESISDSSTENKPRAELIRLKQ